MATAMGVLASTGALRTHISQLFSFFLVHLLEIYTCSSNTQIYSTLGGTLVPTRYARGTLRTELGPAPSRSPMGLAALGLGLLSQHPANLLASWLLCSFSAEAR